MIFPVAACPCVSYVKHFHFIPLVWKSFPVLFYLFSLDNSFFFVFHSSWTEWARATAWYNGHRVCVRFSLFMMDFLKQTELRWCSKSPAGSFPFFILINLWEACRCVWELKRLGWRVEGFIHICYCCTQKKTSLSLSLSSFVLMEGTSRAMCDDEHRQGVCSVTLTALWFGLVWTPQRM